MLKWMFTKLYNISKQQKNLWSKFSFVQTKTRNLEKIIFELFC